MKFYNGTLLQKCLAAGLAKFLFSVYAGTFWPSTYFKYHSFCHEWIVHCEKDSSHFHYASKPSDAGLGSDTWSTYVMVLDALNVDTW